MSFYSNILAASYKFYARFKKEDPHFSSILIVAICQMSIPILIIAIIKKISNIVILPASLNKYYFLPVIVLWLILDFKYFSKSKVQTIITQYEKKKVQEKRFWAIITIISLTIPFIIIPVLLIK